MAKLVTTIRFIQSSLFAMIGYVAAIQQRKYLHVSNTAQISHQDRYEWQKAWWAY